MEGRDFEERRVLCIGRSLSDITLGVLGEERVKEPYRTKRGRSLSLNVAVFPRSVHGSLPAWLLGQLHESRAVRSYGDYDSFAEIERLARAGSVNTIIVSPKELNDAAAFVAKVRQECPKVVIAFYFGSKGSAHFRELCATHPRFKHYLAITDCKPRMVAKVLMKCQEWLDEQYAFDVCLSFAGEDRHYAEPLAAALEKRAARVFLDSLFQANLLGRDLATYLYEIYSQQSRYCAVLVSQHYREKMWPNHERRSALERALREHGAEYLLPIRLDGAELPGIPETIGYLVADVGPERVAEVILEKIGLFGHDRKERL